MDFVLFNEKDTSKSFGKVLSSSRERVKYKDSYVLNFVENIKGVAIVELLENRCRYHGSCYAGFANIEMLLCVEKSLNQHYVIKCYVLSAKNQVRKFMKFRQRMSAERCCQSEKLDVKLVYMCLNTITSAHDINLLFQIFLYSPLPKLTISIQTFRYQNFSN